MENFLEFCQQLSNTTRLLSNHLFKSAFANQFQEIQNVTQATHPRQILHHALTQNNTVPVCICNKNLPWHPDLNTFRQYCSTKCQGIGTIEKRKQTMLAKYGVEHPSQHKDFREKIAATSQLKWGVDHYTQTAECKQRVAETNQKNLGVDRPAQNLDIQAKVKDSWREKWGVDHPMQLNEFKQKIKQTCQQKYGVDNAMQHDEFKQQVKLTTKQKYGVDHLMKDPAYAATVGTQRKKNYYDPDVFDCIHNKEWLSEQNANGKSLGEIADQLGVSSSSLGKYFQKFQIDVIKHSQSHIEKQLAQHFLDQNITVKTRDCRIISPKELDIVFPDAKLAIEVNGAYWHSEQFCKDSQYHLKKTQAAQQAGYELWHFWDWELANDWHKVIRKISSRLQLNTTIAARKLHICTVTTKEKSEFCNQWHLQRDCSSQVNIGLRDSAGQLLMLATYGASRFNKQYDWELLRLCSLGNITVTGGASRLIRYFVDHHMQQAQKLVSYCNLRWSNGNVYRHCGFRLMGQSDPGYVYVKAGKYAGSRYQFQKHKMHKLLETYDPDLSEKQNAQQNGLYRAWDCGNLIFALTK